ncbi:MAG: hypothetical protein IJ489_06970 [Clostridia bacterium]|nr:hypothetical protein [Clostridia bacterium]
MHKPWFLHTDDEDRSCGDLVTETIPADLPPMVEFKVKADAIIKERYGIGVEHIF